MVDNWTKLTTFAAILAAFAGLAAAASAFYQAYVSKLALKTYSEQVLLDRRIHMCAALIEAAQKFDEDTNTISYLSYNQRTNTATDREELISSWNKDLGNYSSAFERLHTASINARLVFPFEMQNVLQGLEGKAGQVNLFYGGLLPDSDKLPMTLHITDPSGVVGWKEYFQKDLTKMDFLCRHLGGATWQP